MTRIICKRLHPLIFSILGDDDSQLNRRHLITFWLRNEDLSWKTPEYLNAKWQQLYYSNTPEQQKFPLEQGIMNAAQAVKLEVLGAGNNFRDDSK